MSWTCYFQIEGRSGTTSAEKFSTFQGATSAEAEINARQWIAKEFPGERIISIRCK
ncbi:MAG: hypothetical protein HQM08_30995 [Candidatus Riflebacteria bacterium]|nr:hypothetical protein [Candidatus Riflebacteria bacterium]